MWYQSGKEFLKILFGYCFKVTLVNIIHYCSVYHQLATSETRAHGTTRANHTLHLSNKVSSIY